MKEIKRLRVIADLVVGENELVVDIGADHGYLSKMLIEENKTKKVIATDISKLSLQKTIDLAEKYQLQEKIETRVGDGLNPVCRENIDFAIIAGMGGYEIIKILSQSEARVKKYILQPSKNQNVIELRNFLVDNGYYIETDFVIYDKKRFYNTICCYKNCVQQKLGFKEIEFGLTNFDLKSEDFLLYLQEYVEKKKEVLNKYPNHKDNEIKIKEALDIINKLYLKKW